MSDSAPDLSRQHPAMTWVRFPRANALFVFAISLLATKIFALILAEYRFYFPANFEATFLLGRENSFHGVYAVAFYTHLIVAPLTLLLALFLVSTGLRSMATRRRGHRLAGRVQAGLVIGFLVPSGLVMATQALAGPIAGVGFMCLSLATGLSVTATAVTAIRCQLKLHRRWAIRSAILLASPLLLRFLAGAAFMLQVDSPEFYRVNAWVSWLLPLAAYQVFCVFVSETPHRWRRFLNPFTESRSRDESLQVD